MPRSSSQRTRPHRPVGVAAAAVTVTVALAWGTSLLVPSATAVAATGGGVLGPTGYETLQIGRVGGTGGPFDEHQRVSDVALEAADTAGCGR